jgi:flavin reductase (DIM6/NTAB) family NADH-FMN oxidoreductase RutF
MSYTPTVPRTTAMCRDDPLLDAFAQLAATVAVVTTRTAAGPVGMTVSTVCSLSMHPPLLLLCADNNSRTLAAIRDSRRFAVNALRGHHGPTATMFARPEPVPGYRFASTAHRHVDGLPVLSEALAAFTCALHQTYPGGDHTIVVGRVLSISRSAGPPLVWHARGYHHLTPATTDQP